MITVKTNNHWRRLYSWNTLTNSEKEDFPEEDYKDFLFFIYKEIPYCYEEFIQSELPESLEGWQGIHHETLSSGLVIKKQGNEVIVGRYDI